MQSRQRDGQTPSRACVCVPFVPLPLDAATRHARSTLLEAPGSVHGDVSKHKQGCWDGFSRRLGASLSHCSPRTASQKRSRRRPRASATQRSKRLYPVGNRQHHNSASEAATKRRNSKNRSLSLTHTDKTDNHVPRDLDRISTERPLRRRRHAAGRVRPVRLF